MFNNKIIENLYFDDHSDFNLIFEKYEKYLALGKYASLVTLALKRFKSSYKRKYKSNPGATDYDTFVNSYLNLKKIGSGGYRNVYAVDEDTVLKISSSNWKLFPNKTEANSKIYSILGDLVPKVYESEREDRLWVLMEKVRPGTSVEKWLKALGVPEEVRFNDFEIACKNAFATSEGIERSRLFFKNKLIQCGYSDKTIAECFNNKLIRTMFDLYSVFGCKSYDIVSDIWGDNIGFAFDGRPVFVDWGGTWGLFNYD